MEKKQIAWIILYFAIVGGLLATIGSWTYRVDPFFHFHKPNIDGYFYPLNNQRSQNDGISKNFEYDGLITGTSMTENFKTSEAEKLFGGSFIKVPYSGGSYKEINDNLKIALSHNSNLNKIIRGLDMGKFFDDKDYMRKELGTYPKYLYDDNIFNDVQYIFNRDVIFLRVYPMTKENDEESFTGGITAFDAYSNWMDSFTFGRTILYPDGVTVKEPAAKVELTEKEKNTILENIHQNVTELADKYPRVTFYYFFTPYSIQWWQSKVEEGFLDKQIEAERIIIQEILKHENIKLFSFNCLTDITTDLNNYKDSLHYGEWINSLMLRYMAEEKYRITDENYKSYLSEEKNLYSNYDYAQLNNQEDYVNDYYAAALFNEEIYDIAPVNIDLKNPEKILMANAEIVSNQYNGQDGILCTGSLQRPVGSEISVGDYIRDTEYVGFKYSIDDLSPYNYLVFYGKKVSDHGQLSVYVYDENGKILRECVENYHNLDNEWHQYLIDVSQINGYATIIFNGGYIDNTGNIDSKYVFSDITLYISK